MVHWVRIALIYCVDRSINFRFSQERVQDMYISEIMLDQRGDGMSLREHVVCWSGHLLKGGRRENKSGIGHLFGEAMKVSRGCVH